MSRSLQVDPRRPKLLGSGQLIDTNMTDANSGDVELEHTRPARPFEGLTICFTAVASDVKAGLIKKLTSMGVLKVEGNLTMDTSALISESFDSVKYQVRPFHATFSRCCLNH